jgi:TctA family transporter
MYWIVVFVASVLGAVVQILIEQGPLPVSHIAEISLVWLLAGFYGLATLIAGLQQLFNSDQIAKSIGWPTGSGFQHELGWAEVGLGVAGFLAIWFRGAYFLAPGIVGSFLYSGAAFVHYRDLRNKGNVNPGNAGPVFYIDIVAPVVVIAMLVLYAPWNHR